MSIKSFIKKHLVLNKLSAIEIPVFQGKILENKVALIVGGSGGIGEAITKAYVQNGCFVGIVGTDIEKLSNICKSINEEHVKYIVADITKTESLQNIMDKMIEMFGRLDIVVHCAGVHCYENFGEISESTWDKVINTNLKSMYFLCQLVANYMIKNNIKGHILTVGSASSEKPGWTPYEISKSGVKALTRGFADKLVKYGIVVNSIAPGPVSTPMLGKESPNENLLWSGNPTGRMCSPSEIANWALFLVSEMGNMVIGDTIFVSGGSGTVCIDK